MMKSLGCAAFGDLLVSFELPDNRTGIDICALDEELEPVYAADRDREDDTRAAMMAIVERRCGVRLDEDWLDVGRPAIFVLACGVPMKRQDGCPRGRWRDHWPIRGRGLRCRG